MTSLPRDAGSAAGAVRPSARPASAKLHPDSGEAQTASPGIGPPAPPLAPLSWGDLPDPAAWRATPPDAPAPAGGAPAAGDGGLAAIRERARLARAQLGDQPLPIANQSSRLILKLLGG